MEVVGTLAAVCSLAKVLNKTVKIIEVLRNAPDVWKRLGERLDEAAHHLHCLESSLTTHHATERVASGNGTLFQDSLKATQACLDQLSDLLPAKATVPKFAQRLSWALTHMKNSTRLRARLEEHLEHLQRLALLMTQEAGLSMITAVHSKQDMIHSKQDTILSAVIQLRSMVSAIGCHHPSAVPPLLGSQGSWAEVPEYLSVQSPQNVLLQAWPANVSLMVLGTTIRCSRVYRMEREPRQRVVEVVWTLPSLLMLRRLALHAVIIAEVHATLRDSLSLKSIQCFFASADVNEDPVIAACRNNDVEVVRRLGHYGHMARLNASALNGLVTAIKHGSTDVVAELIHHRILYHLDINIPVGKDRMTPLEYAIDCNQFDSMSRLLDSGATQDHVDRYSWSASFFCVPAARQGQLCATDNRGWTILQRCAAFSTPSFIAAVLEAGGDAEQVTKPLGWSAISHAVYYMNLPNVEYFLTRFPAQLNHTDDRGWTLLHLAAEAGSLDMIKLLVTAGINTCARTRPGTRCMGRANDLQGRECTAADVYRAYHGMGCPALEPATTGLEGDETVPIDGLRSFRVYEQKSRSLPLWQRCAGWLLVFGAIAKLSYSVSVAVRNRFMV